MKVIHRGAIRLLVAKVGSQVSKQRHISSLGQGAAELSNCDGEDVPAVASKVQVAEGL